MRGVGGRGVGQRLPRPADIRRKMRAAAARVREQLDKMIRSPAYQKHAAGSHRHHPRRPVCRARSRRSTAAEVPGLVHDTSASGATVFVEPIGVVEANNRDPGMRKSREEAEIERILV